MERRAVDLRRNAPVAALWGNGDAPELLAQARTVEIVLGRERVGVAAAPPHEIVRGHDPVATVGRGVRDRT